jgi:hypothetical protein
VRLARLSVRPLAAEMLRAVRASALLLAIIWSQDVFACSCGGWPTPQEARHRATAVFLGVVVDKTPVLTKSEGTWFVVERWTFAVEQSWKGALPTITVAQGNSNCSGIYAFGQRALVYAYPHEFLKSDLETHHCGTPRGSQESQLTSLGRPTTATALTSLDPESAIARVVRHLKVYSLIAIAVSLNVVSMDERSSWLVGGAAIVGFAIAAVTILLSSIFFRRHRRPLLVGFAFVVVGLAGVIFWSGQRYLGNPYFQHLVERTCPACPGG